MKVSHVHCRVREHRCVTPKNAIQDGASILPWSAASVIARFWFRNELSRISHCALVRSLAFVDGINCTPKYCSQVGFAVL